MREFKNFQPYEPIDEVKAAYGLFMPNEELKALFLESEEGIDWYFCAYSLLTNPDTVKVVYEPDGSIVSFNKDASKLVPHGHSVVELDESQVPAGLTNGGWWKWDGERIIKNHAAFVERNIWLKKKRIADAVNEITPLQLAEKTNTITKAERARLSQWELYIIELSRVDESEGENVSWPVKPD